MIDQTADLLLSVQRAMSPVTIHPAPHVLDLKPRCWHCRQKLAEHLTRPWALRCPKCRASNASAAD